MKKIGLIFSTFTITTASSDGRSVKYITPDQIGKSNLIECMYEYMKNKAKSYEKKDQIEKAYKPIEFEIVEHSINGRLYYNEIRGILSSGAYGNDTKLINLEKNIQAHIRTPNEVEVMPFGFSILFRRNSKIMILVTQTYSNSGILGIVREIIEKAIRSVFHDKALKINFHSMVPSDYFNHLLKNNRIKSLNVITTGKFSKDSSDAYSYEEEERIYKNFSMEDNDSFFGNIFRSRSSVKMNSEIKRIGLISETEQVDNIKLVFNINGKPKSVNFDSFYKLEINEDITASVILSPNQSHPEPTKLFEVINEESYPYLLMTNVIKPKQEDEQIDNNIIKGFLVEEKIGKNSEIISEVKQFDKNNNSNIWFVVR